MRCGGTEGEAERVEDKATGLYENKAQSAASVRSGGSDGWGLASLRQSAPSTPYIQCDRRHCEPTLCLRNSLT